MPLIGPARRARRRGIVMGAAIANNRNRRREDEEASATVQQTAAPSEPDYVEELKQLQALKDQNVITAEEFEAKKKQILGL